MATQLKMDGSVPAELLAIRAQLDALADIIIITGEQREKYDEAFNSHFKKHVNDFDDLFPGVIEKNPFRD